MAQAGPTYTTRAEIEAQIESLIALLDGFDGDADLEAACEDEGAQSDDEGVIDYQSVLEYADGGFDQTAISDPWTGVVHRVSRGNLVLARAA